MFFKYYTIMMTLKLNQVCVGTPKSLNATLKNVMIRCGSKSYTATSMYLITQ